MSSPAEAEDDEVEFISEGPARPVLDYIDLSSGAEDEDCSSSSMNLEDQVKHQKRRVASTLERLAQQVALEKKNRANKCRLFKEKQILQRAHGQQELASSSANGANQEAKRCVDMWLKMPGIRPGVVSAGRGGRPRSARFPMNRSSLHTCPVINCGRVYEHASLLDGHLKRFDHSPCDPAISLKGFPSEVFACAACTRHFPTKEEWKRHMVYKMSSSPDGHTATLTYQRIVCFACPACYLFFTLRDECLQHMSAKNHFTEALVMTETRGRAMPVPVPEYVKNRLIALCKNTFFTVKCSSCHTVLHTHQSAQAHFNVLCRHGSAVATANKTIVQVMKQLQVRGQCVLCCKIFLSQAEIERHKESTQHEVEVNQTMEKAILQHCRFGGTQQAERAREALEKGSGLEASFQKRIKKTADGEESPAKRRKQSLNGSRGRTWRTAWRCECGLQFPEEAAATNHLLAINQIFHQCGVCGKHMGESSITRLHMSRMHGGAHLSNFLFYCRKCNVEMPRYEDILLHVSQNHSGHTYYYDQEVEEEKAAAPNPKPSTSTSAQSAAQMSPIAVEQAWMCRMCEEVFDSKQDVQKHCSDINAHNYQRFVCGHCPQKFFKESTVRRHCMNEHDGQVKSSYFCGLCDSTPFKSQNDFLEHYKSLHSKDYCCVDGGDPQPAVEVGTSQPACPCMSSEKGKEEMKAMYTQCMRGLSAEGKCQYVCSPCGITLSSYAQMKTHIHTQHAALNLSNTFDVECTACQEKFTAIPSFHKHYHSRHCALEPCTSGRICTRDKRAKPTTGKEISAEEIEPNPEEIKDEAVVMFLNMDQASEGSDAESEIDDETLLSGEGGEAAGEIDDEMLLSAEAGEAADEIDDEMLLSAEAGEAAALQEALKRSLVDF